MWAIASTVVCLSVCVPTRVLVNTDMSPAKTAEPIEKPSAETDCEQTHVDPRNHY